MTRPDVGATLGRVIKHETRANGVTLWESVTAYDGWIVSRYDANGHRTDRTLDAFGQLVQVVEHNDAGSGPVTYTTGYVYDLSGNLTGVTDHHGNVTSMSYDLLGRKTAMTDPDMGTWQYQYDGNGNLTAQQDGRGLWLHLGYDALDRLVSKRRESPSGTLLAEYVYDTLAKGQLYAAKAYDGSGNVQVETRTSGLDDRYRATEQQWIVAGQGTFRLATAYNAADQVIALTYPGDNANGLGEVVTQSYDAAGQLGEVRGAGGEAYVASASYNAQGRVTQMSSGNGLTRQYDYATDTLRLTGIRAGMAAPWTDLQDFNYTFDDAGNILTLTDGVNSGQVQSFGYDWLDRLTSASTTAVGDGQYSRAYAYDAIGNIISFAGSSYTYSSTQPHAVTSAHGNSYGYDANGNQTTRTIGGTTYTVDFDDENRLTAVKHGGTVIGEFVYDAGGSRVVGTVNGVTTVYIGGLFEWQAGGGTTSYYRGPGGAIAFRRSGYASDNGVYYLLRDHLGSSSVIVDGSGTVAKRELYYPFGGNRGSAFSDLTTRRFTGQYHEQALPGGEGLSYYNARWYDAQIGRFVSADTIVPEPSNPQDLNRYAYVRNNPLRFTDPTGHYLFEESPGDPDYSIRRNVSGKSISVRSRPAGIWSQTGLGRSQYRRSQQQFNRYRADYWRYQHDLTTANNDDAAFHRIADAKLYAEYALRKNIDWAVGGDHYLVGEALIAMVDPEATGVYAAAAAIHGITFINPAKLRWTQRTAGGRGRAKTLRESMTQNGWDGPPIDVVQTPDGLVTVDHTRAIIALELDMKQIPVRIHDPSDLLPNDMLGRFGPSRTWGEAIAYRASRQRPPLPPTGTTNIPHMPY